MRKENAQKPNSAEKPDEELRAAFKKQAQELAADKEAWRPTWKALGIDFAHKELAKGSRGAPAGKWMKKTP